MRKTSKDNAELLRLCYPSLSYIQLDEINIEISFKRCIFKYMCLDACLHNIKNCIKWRRKKYTCPFKMTKINVKPQNRLHLKEFGGYHKASALKHALLETLFRIT